MRPGPLWGVTVALIGGYLALKWALIGVVEPERLVGYGGIYHWTALSGLTAGWSAWMIRTTASSKSFWGDFKILAKPVVVYALLASGAVWLWNHVLASDATELRKALRLAQIDDQTSTPEAYAAFVEQQPEERQAQFPDRLEYKEQATSQVTWMLSGGVTLIFSMLAYLVAALILALCATLLLHHIWGVATLS